MGENRTACHLHKQRGCQTSLHEGGLMLSCKEDLTCPSGNVVSVRHPVLHIRIQDVEPVIHKQQPLCVQPCSVVWGGAVTMGQQRNKEHCCSPISACRTACASLTWPMGIAPLGSQSLCASAMCCSSTLAAQASTQSVELKAITAGSPIRTS